MGFQKKELEKKWKVPVKVKSLTWILKSEVVERKKRTEKQKVVIMILKNHSGSVLRMSWDVDLTVCLTYRNNNKLKQNQENQGETIKNTMIKRR